MLEEQLGEGRLVVKHADHAPFLQSHDRALGHRYGFCHPYRMSSEAGFPEEVAGAEYCDNGFFALIGYDRKLDPALANIKDSVRRIALREDHLFLPVVRYRLSFIAHLGQKDRGIER